VIEKEQKEKKRGRRYEVKPAANCKRKPNSHGGRAVRECERGTAQPEQKDNWTRNAASQANREQRQRFQEFLCPPRLRKVYKNRDLNKVNYFIRRSASSLKKPARPEPTKTRKMRAPRSSVLNYAPSTLNDDEDFLIEDDWQQQGSGDGNSEADYRYHSNRRKNNNRFNNNRRYNYGPESMGTVDVIEPGGLGSNNGAYNIHEVQGFNYGTGEAVGSGDGYDYYDDNESYNYGNPNDDLDVERLLPDLETSINADSDNDNFGKDESNVLKQVPIPPDYYVYDDAPPNVLPKDDFSRLGIEEEEENWFMREIKLTIRSFLDHENSLLLLVVITLVVIVCLILVVIYACRRQLGGYKQPEDEEEIEYY